MAVSGSERQAKREIKLGSEMREEEVASAVEVEAKFICLQVDDDQYDSVKGNETW